MKVEITKPQLKAIIDLMEDIESMIGCGDNDEEWAKDVAKIKRFLAKNNIVIEEPVNPHVDK